MKPAEMVRNGFDDKNADVVKRVVRSGVLQSRVRLGLEIRLVY